MRSYILVLLNPVIRTASGMRTVIGSTCGAPSTFVGSLRADILLSLARPVERAIARQEAIQHERDKVRDGLPPSVCRVVGVGIGIQRVEHVAIGRAHV